MADVQPTTTDKFGEHYPVQLATRFPRVFKRVDELWGKPDVDDYLFSLIVDQRGGRQGFPPDVMSELIRLQHIHEIMHPRKDNSPWAQHMSEVELKALTEVQSFLAHQKAQPHPADTSPRSAAEAVRPAEQATAKRNSFSFPAPATVDSIDKLIEERDRKALPAKMQRLGEALIEEGVLTESDLTDALEFQRNHRGYHLGEILVNMGLVEQVQVNRLLSRRLGIPYVNLKKLKVSPEALERVPPDVAAKYMAMPVCLVGKKLIVAVEDPLKFEGREFLSFYTHMAIELVMADRSDIEAAIRSYGEVTINDIAQQDSLDDLAPAEQVKPVKPEAEPALNDNAVVRLVNKIINDAHAQGASDIHIETQVASNRTIIRFRKDGSLTQYFELPPVYRNPVISRLKIMCNLDISEKRKPQDGKINFANFGGLELELRVATIPTLEGYEDVVMRLLAQGKPKALNDIGLSPRNQRAIEEIAAKPYGLFLVCGPTGSGKTTSLHSVLNHLNTPDRKIWTAEDPVEITQDGLCQVQVNAKIGFDFAAAMRSFLRADPDVIMVGEMRDLETTKMGIEASLTGHLVLSTLHTNSASESIVRLLDLGMDPFNFADALLGVLAQRLAKSLCSKCKKLYYPKPEELEALLDEFCLTGQGEEISALYRRQDIMDEWKARFGDGNGRLTLYAADGCEACDHTGYAGRFGLHELLVASPEVKRLVRTRAPVSDILAAGLRAGMRTLKQDGIEKVLRGIADMRQVRAVCT